MHPSLATMTEVFDRIAICKEFLMAGPIIGATCALLSVYIVLRRMALIAEGVSHAGFGGIAVAIVLGYFLPVGTGVGQQIITGIFCLGTALLIGYVTRRKRVSNDSAIGIFLVSTVALGELLINVRSKLPPLPGKPNIPVNVESLLFGDFADVIRVDVYVALAAMVIVFSIIGLMYYQFLYTTLDEEMARINGVNTRLVNTLLLMMISLVIVTCVRMVGFLMITALTIIPGATANMLSRRFIGVLVISLLIGTLGTSAATWIAIVPPFDKYSPGPIVVLTLFAIFVVVWLFRQLIKPKVIPTETAPAPTHPSSFGSGHSH